MRFWLKRKNPHKAGCLFSRKSHMERRKKMPISMINEVFDPLAENESLNRGELKERSSMVGRRAVFDFQVSYECHSSC